jgi:transcriptional regulator
LAIYIPPSFAGAARAAVARLLHDYPFATLITPGAPEPWLSHVPLLLTADREPYGTLIGHVARANPHWQHMRGPESIAIFHGPHAYVSPSWYGEPAQAVPTWNFAAIHAHGTIDLLDDSAATRGVLDVFVKRFEGGRAAPWTFAMAERPRDALIGAIVAFRLRIARLDVKFKLSQNRSRDDRARVIAALKAEGYAEATATAAWMHEYASPDNDADEPRE